MSTTLIEDRSTRGELAREAFEEWLEERRCPLHAKEVVLYADDETLLVGCPTRGCPVRPVEAGAF